MPFRRRVLGLLLAFLVAGAWSARAQAVDPGTRAQGMGGAFVGVADDASAVYWNPAGLAGGSYFSLLVDGGTAGASPDGALLAGGRSDWMLALSTPALGLSFYRLHTAAAAPAGTGASAPFRLQTLSTRHLGATLVQSLTETIAVGATVKLVRGTAGSAEVAATSAEDAVKHWDIAGRGSSKFDLDAGIMATGALGRVGLVVRNLTEPSFETGGGLELPLERQVRAGGSFKLLPRWILAGDLDLTRTHGTFGDVRELAFGTEGQVTRRLAARGGLRFNTTGEDGRSPAVSAGGSFAVMGSFLLDAQVTAGGDRAFAGWGLAGRFVY